MTGISQIEASTSQGDPAAAGTHWQNLTTTLGTKKFMSELRSVKRE